MKNGQLIDAETAKILIEEYGVSLVIDTGDDVTEKFTDTNIEAADSFTLNANFPSDCFLLLNGASPENNLSIYLKNAPGHFSFGDAEWKL